MRSARSALPMACRRIACRLPRHGAKRSASPPRKISRIRSKVNARLSSVSRVLELKVDAGSGLTVATVKDSRTGEALQQFPGTNSLELAQILADWAGGKNALLDLIA